MQLQQQDSTPVDHGQASAPRPAPFVIFPQDPFPSGLITSIKQDHSSSFYGPFDAAVLAAQAAAIINDNSDASEASLKEVIHRFLALARDDETPETARCCWLSIRMTLPTTSWVVPRWHTDGRMFTCSCPPPQLPHSKYAVTILGPSTRVMASDPAVTAVLNAPSPTGRHWDQNDPDPELAERLADFEEAVVGSGQVIRFSWGEADSPVHSEPDSSVSARVFVSLLLAREEEILDMCEFRGVMGEYGTWH